MNIEPAQPARGYNDPASLPVPPGELRAAVLRTIDEVAGHGKGPRPEPDGRLCLALDAVARVTPSDAPPSYAAVDFALALQGIIEPSPHLIVIRAGERDTEGLTRELGARLPAVLASGDFLRVGVGVAPVGDGTTTLIVGLQESFLSTGPVPRKAPAAGTVSLRGTLRTPYAEPQVFVTGPDGSVEKLRVARQGGRGFRAEVRCAQAAGRHQVEIVGHGTRGASVLANFPIWCGEEPPSSLPIVLGEPAGDATTDPREAEQEILALANADRQRAGLPPLVWDERAAAVSRAHSQEMRDDRYVGHVSPKTGSAADRARHGGIATPLVLENLARAYSPAEAHLGLMNSPGHRKNLLSPEATHLGVGVALGESSAGPPELYVTQLFFRVPPKLDAARGRDDAWAAIARRRQAAGAPPLARDADLDGIAQSFAQRLAAGGDRKQAETSAAEAVDDLGDRLGAVLTIVTVVGDPAEVATDVVTDRTMRRAGLGLAQGRDERMGEGALHAVILLARPR